MRRLLIMSLLALTFLSGLAIADRDRRNDRRDDRRDRRDDRRDNRQDRRNDRRDTVRDHRNNRRDTIRTNRRHNRYNGPIRANRRAVTRHNQLRHTNGRFTFHNGRTYNYVRPVIRNRYYDVRVRPQVIVENIPAQYGYIWVSGNWSWTGREWSWNDGYYAPDPEFSVYYDDDSYDCIDC